jgi:hypothetical protein
VALALITYIYSFATWEAEAIKQGEGTHLEITLADNDVPVKTSLLGTSVNYVFTYDPVKDEAIVYFQESIKAIKNVPAGHKPVEEEKEEKEGENDTDTVSKD